MTDYRDAYRIADEEAADALDRCARLRRERDKARAEVERLRALVTPMEDHARNVEAAFDRMRTQLTRERDEAREQLLMMTRQRDLLRRGHLTTRVDEIRAAIGDPGAVVPRLDGAETVPAWCARAVVAVLSGTSDREVYIRHGGTPGGADVLARAGVLADVVANLDDHPTPADDPWAALDEAITPIIASELGCLPGERDQAQAPAALDTILAALEADIATMPSEAAIAALVRRVAELPDSVPLAVDAVRALADERGSHAMTAASFEDYTEVAEDWRATLASYEREGKSTIHYRDSEEPYLVCECGEFVTTIDHGDAIGHLRAMTHEHCEDDHDTASPEAAADADPYVDPDYGKDLDDEDPLAWAG